MIAVARPAEPADFDATVRQPGRRWLAAHPDARRPRDYWSCAKPALAAAFGGLCGYSAMYEPVGTVDHFVSCRTDPSLAYEWSNYRYASQWVNSSKQTADDEVLDPFLVADGWFEVDLPSLQLHVVADRVPPEYRELAQATLLRLHLRDDERVLRQRQAWYRLYQDGEITLDGLRRMAPLIARAVERQEASRVEAEADRSA